MSARAPILVPLLAALLAAGEAAGQASRNMPHVGYVYPAGARHGSTIQVLVGGQFLGSITGAHVTGEGVTASFEKHYRPIRNLTQEQRQALGGRLRDLLEERWAELAETGAVERRPPWRRAARPRQRKADVGEVTLPDHPLINDLEHKSLRELLHVREALTNRRFTQRHPQIAEMVLLEVTIDSDATPGDRELRLLGRAGATNPLCFQVGALPEANEVENNDPTPFDPLPKEPAADLPIVLNGQIMPGDVDRFRLNLRRGQQIVVEGCARALNPFLPDAVPGWFQAVMTLSDPSGQEVLCADDYRFDPDPVLLYRVPETGVYELEIRDSIYRGRQDFVYRITVSQHPFITQLFPLGGRAGAETIAEIDGWNLSTRRLPLDTQPGPAGTRQVALGRGRRVSNALLYAVDALPECAEAEPNDTVETAQPIELPVIVNGAVAQPGDVDVFQFSGRAGETVVAEVVGRRLRSPLDSLLRLTDSAGTILAWNDDTEHTEGHLHTDVGLLTHQADSYLRAPLPADGVYFLEVSDTQGHGSEASCYRLRVSPPMPDVTLCATPSSINVPGGLAALLDVYVTRHDGFEGPIELALADAPEGFHLRGAVVPAGRTHARITLSASPDRLDDPVTLRLAGRAMIDETPITRPVHPADNVMQAFLYRHLVPAQAFVVAMMGGRRPGGAIIDYAEGVPVELAPGERARLHVPVPRMPRRGKLLLRLSDAPPWISLGEVSSDRDGVTFQLHADADAAPVGAEEHLIIEVTLETTQGGRDDRRPRRTRRQGVGVLPALPVRVVAPRVGAAAL